jgi:hypothetical protein
LIAGSLVPATICSPTTELIKCSPEQPLEFVDEITGEPCPCIAGEDVPGSSNSWIESFLDFVDDITEEPNPCLIGEDVPSNQASTLMVLARRPS